MHPVRVSAGTPATTGSTRTFKTYLTTKAELRESLADFAARCGERLRQQGSVASTLTAFIDTDRFRKDQPQYSRSFPVTFTTPTNSTLLLVRAAHYALDKIYRDGFAYKKGGVMLSGLVDQGAVLPTLFDPVDHEKHGRLMAVLDGVNRKFGRNVVRTAAQSLGGVANITQQGALSPAYTTDWVQMLRVDIT